MIYAYGKLNLFNTRVLPNPSSIRSLRVQTKLPTDGKDHPYGQWTSQIDVIAKGINNVPAFLSFLVKSVQYKIKCGDDLQLYAGTNHIGTFHVIGKKFKS